MGSDTVPLALRRVSSFGKAADEVQECCVVGLDAKQDGKAVTL